MNPTRSKTDVCHHTLRLALDWKPKTSGRNPETLVDLERNTERIQDVATQQSPEGAKGSQSRESLLGRFPALVRHARHVLLF